MSTTLVVPHSGINLGAEETHELIRRAQEADAQDRALTIREALKKYKSAVTWALLLSTSLVMEGYDLVIVSRITEEQQNFQYGLTCRESDQFFLRPGTISEQVRRGRPL